MSTLVNVALSNKVLVPTFDGWSFSFQMELFEFVRMGVISIV